MTLAPVTNANIKPKPNPNPNPYTTLNQKPNDNPRSYSLLQEISLQEQLLPEQMSDHHFLMQSKSLNWQ